MSVLIGFRIGVGISQPSCVLITEEHDGLRHTTEIDPVQFLKDSGLGNFFYQLKPEFARALKRDARKKAKAKK